MKTYFKHCENINELKSEFKKLAFQLHPDHNGNAEEFKAMIAQYESLLKNFDRFEFTGSDAETHTYYYNEKVEQDLINKIDEVLKAKLQNIDIDLIGRWIWITGETKTVKSELKEMKFRWHSKRKAWYFHTSKKKTRFNKNASLNDLKQSYGCNHYTSEKQARIA